MATQTVFRLTGKGNGYNSLRELTEPIPQPQAHEAVLQICAATFNFRDLAVANGDFPFTLDNDIIPLADAAGVITAVGASVVGLQVGDYALINYDLARQHGPQTSWNNLLGTANKDRGACQQYIVLPETCFVRVPKSTTLSWPELASLVCTGAAAWDALFGGGVPLKPGDTVLFQGTGGASLCGLIIAKAAGAVTIVTSSSDAKLNLIQERYEPDYTINYSSTPDWAAEVNRITDGRGVNRIFEVGGTGTIVQSIECIAPGGQIIVMGYLSYREQPESKPDIIMLMIGKGCTLRAVLVGSKQMTEEVVKFACAKNLQLPIDKEFRFEREQIIEAYRTLERGDHIGKIALRISEST